MLHIVKGSGKMISNDGSNCEESESMGESGTGGLFFISPGGIINIIQRDFLP